MKNDQARSGASSIADRIADALFTNGAGQKAKRLVLELEGGGADGGGWCRAAVAAAVRRVITLPGGATREIVLEPEGDGHG